MEFVTFSHRNAETLFTYDEKYMDLYYEVCDAIHSISERDLIDSYNHLGRASKKSLSQPINNLIKERLEERGWSSESPIFETPGYTDKRWRLDFAKKEISIEVAFNHGEAISWNLLKPVMASELNHIEKAIQTSAGIVICATAALKERGNFDSAVGEYEKFIRYLTPMFGVLPSPILLIGLEAPESFYIDHNTKQIVIENDSEIDAEMTV